MPILSHLLLVFLGGGLGSICRWSISLTVQPWQARFPWATLVANALACLVLGILLGLQTNGSLSAEKRLLLVTGFCGGFSTFSTFTAETLQAFQNGHYLSAAANVLGSLIICFVCLLLGIKMTA